jgi:hypothetical protein
MKLPEDIIKHATHKNWRRLWRKYMIIEDTKAGWNEFVWAPEAVEKFISQVVKSMKK